MPNIDHRLRTLLLVTILHGFTHVYQVALMPLYLPIRDSLKLSGIGQATFLLTLMYVAYFLPSYFVGVLADRFSRKKLLACGLTLNGIGFIGLGLAPNYATALVCAVLAGIGGSTFHPAATALIARLYPGVTGRALGFVGIGASIGFFFGPMYAGWRAAQSGNWRLPILELGVAGVVAAGLFAWFAVEDAAPAPARHESARSEPMFPSSALWLIFVFAAIAFSWRDFAGSSMGTLGSLFLQKARGFGVQETGLAISFIFIASAVSNPLFGHLSDRNRLTWAAGVALIAAVFIAMFPHVPRAWVIPTLAVYGFFFMAGYPIVEAALMEAVPDAVRGRVFGLFITIGGFLGNLAHWVAGRWVQAMGAAESQPSSYYLPYAVLSGLLVASLVGLPCLRALHRREAAIRPEVGRHH